MSGRTFINTTDKEHAEIELAHIDAALLVANASNDIACEIRIGQLHIGISVNKRVIPVLEKEREEIIKFLNGQQNNWE